MPVDLTHHLRRIISPRKGPTGAVDRSGWRNLPGHPIGGGKGQGISEINEKNYNERYIEYRFIYIHFNEEVNLNVFFAVNMY